MNCAHLNAAFRRWTWSHSRAVFANNGNLGALRRILADVPCYLLEFTR